MNSILDGDNVTTYDSKSSLSIVDGIRVVTDSGKSLYAERIYFDKMLRSVGFKGGSRAITSALDLTEDSKLRKISNIDIKNNLLVEGNKDSFIYIDKATYASICEILRSIIQCSDSVNFRGDIEDLTHFECIFQSDENEMVLEVNLVKEWAYLYMSRSSGRINPYVLSHCNLWEPGAIDAIQCAITTESLSNSLDVIRNQEMSIANLVEFLLSTNLIKKRSSRMNSYIACAENESIQAELVPLLEIINSCDVKFRYVNTSGFTYNNIIDIVSKWYSIALNQNKENKFAVSNFLWVQSKLGGINV